LRRASRVAKIAVETVRTELAKRTGRDVEYQEASAVHRFRLSDPTLGTHWLEISRDLVAAEGETGVLARLAEVVPHLTTKHQSLRVTLTANRVIAEPAAD
jgi:hypothetical protein